MESSTSTSTSTPIPISSTSSIELATILSDFCRDFIGTFPEYSDLVVEWQRPEQLDSIQQHMFTHMAPHFFDIMYKHDSLFQAGPDQPCEFLPGLSFSIVWQSNISEHTRSVLWNYLSLFLMAVVKSSNLFPFLSNPLSTSTSTPTCMHEPNSNPEPEPDLSSMFESMGFDFDGNMDVDQWTETIQKSMEVFTASMEAHMKEKEHGSEKVDSKQEPTSKDVDADVDVDADEDADADPEWTAILQEFMDGKLGSMVKEIMDELGPTLMSEFGLNPDQPMDPIPILKTLFMNPGKLKNLYQVLSNKLASKMESGEFTQEEIMSEGMKMFQKVKSMPGMDHMEEMIQSMMGGWNKKKRGGQSQQQEAMQLMIQRQTKRQEMLDRMAKRKLDKIAQAQERLKQKEKQPTGPALSEEELIALFSSSSKKEKGKEKGKGKGKK